MGVIKNKQMSIERDNVHMTGKYKGDVKPIAKEPEPPRRHFGGKLSGFADKQERAFEQKHLKAYLKGAESFPFGKDKDGNVVYHKVKEVWS